MDTVPVLFYIGPFDITATVATTWGILLSADLLAGEESRPSTLE